MNYVKGSVDHLGISFKTFNEIFHFVYILLTSFIYLLFGIENRLALIVFQIIISSILPILIFKISVERYDSKNIALLFTFISMIFFGNINWTNWADPTSFFRFIFFLSYYYLLNLFFIKKDYKSFFIFSCLFFLILVFTRPDTIILYIPIYILLFIIFIKHMQLVEKLVTILTGSLVLIGLHISINIPHVIAVLTSVLRGLFINGDVIIQYSRIEPFNYNLANDYFYLVCRAGKLFYYRLYEFVNIFPPFWSKAHQLYYASYMVVFYFFSIFAIIRLYKKKDLYFSFFLFAYLSSMMMHMLTRVDAALRTNFVHIPFLILVAGYGCDYLYSVLKSRLGNRASLGNR